VLAHASCVISDVANVGYDTAGMSVAGFGEIGEIGRDIFRVTQCAILLYIVSRSTIHHTSCWTSSQTGERTHSLRTICQFLLSTLHLYVFSDTVFYVASGKAYKDEVAVCLSSVHCPTQVIWGANDQVQLFSAVLWCFFSLTLLRAFSGHHLVVLNGNSFQRLNLGLNFLVVSESAHYTVFHSS